MRRRWEGRGDWMGVTCESISNEDADISIKFSFNGHDRLQGGPSIGNYCSSKVLNMIGALR